MNDTNRSYVGPKGVSSLRSIDLNLFVLFDAIYSEGSLTGAGARLGLTQPAVSHALARLRDKLGEPLFLRKGHRMVPTPYARSLIGDVRRAMAILQARLSGPLRFEPHVSTATFRIALPQTHETAILVPLFERLSQVAPGVSIVSSRVSRRDFEAELTSGGLDLAIDLVAPVGIGIRRQPLFSDRLVVATRRGHRAFKTGLSLDAYLGADHVLVSSRRHGGGVEDFELNRLGLQRRIALRCQSTRAAVEVVSKTDLILTLTEKQLVGLKRLADLARFDLPFEARTFEPEMYWDARVDDDPGNSWLRGMIADLF